MNFMQAAAGNYKKGRAGSIKYIVIHYTANNGDTAFGNANYFRSNKNLQASAHYFVDENEVWQSVKESDTAFHCGAKHYRHSECRNSNSIGVELCSRKSGGGKYYFKGETEDRAAELVKSLMKKYGIDTNHVLRHFDVTGKNCPEPFVRDVAQWVKFGQMIIDEGEEMTAEQFEKMMANYQVAVAKKDPALWSKEARAWAEKSGIIKGDGSGMAYQSSVTREELVMILYRFAQAIK